MKNVRIDKNTAFDWGKASEDYAKYRDIYSDEVFDKIRELGFCTDNKSVLDLGTGTGILPRKMYKYGAHFTASDISQSQIDCAVALSSGMDIDYIVSPVEELSLKSDSFEQITALMCFFYFDNERAWKNINRMLKSGGRLLVLYMNWLPFEDELAKRSEQLVLKYNKNWTGHSYMRHEIKAGIEQSGLFVTERKLSFDVDVPFSRESYNGRMRACRGTGATLGDRELKEFEHEHMQMLVDTMPQQFCVKHHVTIAVYKTKK